MRTAILGWPQVGKSALFKMLCGPQAPADAYGVHTGVARLPDARLDALAQHYKTRKTTPGAVEFLDSPPLLNEPEKDNTVFGQVRGADVFAHVIRLFGADVNPTRDCAQLETEFLLMDLDTVDKRRERVARELKKSRTPELEHEYATLEKVRAALAAETPLREVGLTPEERKIVSGFMLLSAKPLLVVLNAPDEDAPNLDALVQKHNLADWADKPGVLVRATCAKIESELSELNAEEASEFMTSYGLKESAREALLHGARSLAGLMTFFTAGEPECRAWLAPKGAAAVEAAGIIHSDFARRFIKAEVISWKELLDCGGLSAARERGLVRLEGKETPIADGDVLYIRHTA